MGYDSLFSEDMQQSSGDATNSSQATLQETLTLNTAYLPDNLARDVFHEAGRANLWNQPVSNTSNSGQAVQLEGAVSYDSKTGAESETNDLANKSKDSNGEVLNTDGDRTKLKIPAPTIPIVNPRDQSETSNDLPGVVQAILAEGLGSIAELEEFPEQVHVAPILKLDQDGEVLANPLTADKQAKLHAKMTREQNRYRRSVHRMEELIIDQNISNPVAAMTFGEPVGGRNNVPNPSKSLSDSPAATTEKVDIDQLAEQKEQLELAIQLQQAVPLHQQKSFTIDIAGMQLETELARNGSTYTFNTYSNGNKEDLLQSVSITKDGRLLESETVNNLVSGVDDPRYMTGKDIISTIRDFTAQVIADE